MSVTFCDAKDGSLTCKINGFFLHSAYSPLKEAERFCLSIKPDFLPKYVLFISPGLPYCTEILRKQFPSIKLIAIQFVKDFQSSNKSWDYVYTISNDDSYLSFEKFLNSFLSEDDVFSTIFLCWQNANTIFTNEISLIWSHIKKYVAVNRDILGTKCYFNKRWIHNSVRNILAFTNTATLKSGNTPIVIAASGPELLESISLLKFFRDKFFLLAVSSAIAPLLSHGIIPDLCISTDGGYWAKKHLDTLLSDIRCKDIPIAISTESSIPYQLLSERTIVPLNYGDGLGAAFLSECKIESLKAVRNGTVSGTSLLLALHLTTNDIFLCGLDLAVSKGYQHINPNMLEIRSASTDYRFSPLTTRLASSYINSGSLVIYRNWFSSHTDSFENRVYRISNGKTPAIPTLHNLSSNDFSSYLNNFQTNDLLFPKLNRVLIENVDYRKSYLLSFLNKIKASILSCPTDVHNNDLYSICAPTEYIKFNRCISGKNKDSILETLVSQTIFFLQKLEKDIVE